MDYARIYGDFIADRLTKQPVRPTYFEKHHILPRALGGEDVKSNIIRLTPEDHFFAHLLLAKTHGGRMWYAVVAMSNGWRRDRNIGKAGSCRSFIGAARRELAVVGRARLQRNTDEGDPMGFIRFGERNGLHNPEKYKWINLDTGIARNATIYEMWKEFGSSRAHWTSVKSGARRSHTGWAMEETPVRIRGLKGKSLTFINEDGRIHLGTQNSFCKATGLSVAVASRVSRHGHKTSCGWRLKTD